MERLKLFLPKAYLLGILSLMLMVCAISVSSLYFVTTARAEYSASLDAPEGILKNNVKVKDTTTTMNWILKSVALVMTIIFGINAGKKLNDEQYTGAIGPILGAVLAGTATFLAYSITS
ncbi:MAG: hypothetical protein HQK53_05600 [Oligoflexia bacterium]|nr:hypothetical protein [Oligoflexia bacterium]